MVRILKISHWSTENVGKTRKNPPSLRTSSGSAPSGHGMPPSDDEGLAAASRWPPGAREKLLGIQQMADLSFDFFCWLHFCIFFARKTMVELEANAIERWNSKVFRLWNGSVLSSLCEGCYNEPFGLRTNPLRSACECTVGHASWLVPFGNHISSR